MRRDLRRLRANRGEIETFTLLRFLETAGTVLNYFESFLGRIEIKTADKVGLFETFPCS